MSQSHVWQFIPNDTWFFRETRPHDAVGGSELASMFPPSARTVCGAIRTTMGSLAGVDWKRYRDDRAETYEVNGVCLRKEIGFVDRLGKMTLAGPYLMVAGTPAFAAPGFLLRHVNDDGMQQLVRLEIGDGVETDLESRTAQGKVEVRKLRLPRLPAESAGARSLENVWLPKQVLEAVLRGDTPQPDQVFGQQRLYVKEARLGIALNAARRSTETGLLYQTQHLRLQHDVSVGAQVSGVSDHLHPRQTVQCRFGGEGRLASADVQPGELAFPQAPQAKAETHGLILIAVTDVDLDGQSLPQGFIASVLDDLRVWKGELAGIELTIHSAVIGKVRQEGGWNLAASHPRPVRSYVPAGSGWFCTVDGASGTDLTTAIATLHGHQIGIDKAWGRGCLAVGLWNDQQRGMKS